MSFVLDATPVASAGADELAAVVGGESAFTDADNSSAVVGGESFCKKNKKGKGLD